METQGEVDISPAWTEPLVFDVGLRITELEKTLLDKSFKCQEANIELAIEMYKNGKLPKSGTTWFLNGVACDIIPTPIPKGSALWAEGMYMGCMEATLPWVVPHAAMPQVVPHAAMPQVVPHAAIPQVVPHVAMPQMVPYVATPQTTAPTTTNPVSYGKFAINHMHEIFARFRLVPELGGDPSRTIDVSIANDTGCNIQFIFLSDIERLGYDPETYMGRLGNTTLYTPAGWMVREKLIIEIQLITRDREAASTWFHEIAAVVPARPGFPQARLSGESIRHHFYFATAPRNRKLYIADNTYDLVSQLCA